MNFTPEQITKAKAVKSVEELLAIAKENGLELTEEEAKKYFAELHKEGELSDDELDNVSGGCGESEEAPSVQPEPLYHAGQRFRTDKRVGGRCEYMNILSNGQWDGETYYYDVEDEIIRGVYLCSEQRITDRVVQEC